MTIEARYGYPEEPYCFETDREEQWYMCGQVDGAKDQDRIARQEERERAAKWWEDRCDAIGISKYQVELFRKAMEGLS